MNLKANSQVTFFVKQLPSVSNFFIQESRYEELIAQEVNFLVENHYSYNDVMYMMPVYMRKKIITIILERNQKILKEKQRAAGYQDI
jgi:hypothetical protein